VRPRRHAAVAASFNPPSTQLNPSTRPSRATLDNSQTKPYESIPESDVSDMTYFLIQLSVVLPALGIELFSPANLEKAERTVEFEHTPATATALEVERRQPFQPINGPETIEVLLRDSVFGIEAHGLESNGEVLVLKGSRARGENESEVNVYRQLRLRLIKEGKIVSTANPRVLEFASDVLFNSPSAASAVILDRNDNGRSSWREKTSNKSLNTWYAEQANKAKQPSEQSA